MITDEAPVKPTAPDQEPGFWSEFVEPKSEVARAVQFPIDSPSWSGRVINAYLKDTKRSRALEDRT